MNNNNNNNTIYEYINSLSFFLNNLNDIPKEITYCISDPKLVVASLISAINDTNLLTQRTCMELILTHFKIEEKYD
jgi:hypothetical protein